MDVYFSWHKIIQGTAICHYNHWISNNDVKKKNQQPTEIFEFDVYLILILYIFQANKRIQNWDTLLKVSHW